MQVETSTSLTGGEISIRPGNRFTYAIFCAAIVTLKDCRIQPHSKLPSDSFASPYLVTRRRLLTIASASAVLAALAGCDAEEEDVTPTPTAEATAPVAPVVETSSPAPVQATPTLRLPTVREPARPSPTPSPTTTSSPAATPSPTREPTSTPTPTPTPTSTPTPTPTPIPLPTSPLSGLTGTAEIVGRRPIAVKIPNDVESRPSTGLSEAEVVYEHETEGRITRFTAFFVLSDLEKVGPIRSARFVDVGLVREYSALFAHVGGSPPVRDALTRLGDLDRDEFFYGPDGPFFRADDRNPPHNIYIDLPKLRADAESIGLAPLVDISPWVFYDETPEHGTTSSIQIPAVASDSGPQTKYEYDPETRSYKRWIDGKPLIDALNGSQISVENVIVQFTKTELTEHVEDAAGNLSLAIETVGAGRVLVFHDGHRIDGRWIRRDLDSRTRFVSPSGRPIALRPGHSWVHLLDNREQILAG